MDKIIRNYYSGYEGEPEIQFIRVTGDGQRFILRIWVGFFDNIMMSIKPVANEWTSLAYYYHLVEGWHDESPWKVPDIGAAISQFRDIDVASIDKNSQEVLYDICEMLLVAEAANESVFIAYE